MTQYQFERIYTNMGKEFGKIRRGQEDEYYQILFSLEEAALLIHREFPTSNSRRMKEAILLVLFDIQSRYTGESPDVSAFRNEDNARLEKGLLMTFDPLTNDELRKMVEQDNDLNDPKVLRNYYEVFIRCLLRIYESVQIQEKRMGSNGYFDFLEQVMGSHLGA